MMHDAPAPEPPRHLVWRRGLSEAERARLQAWLEAHPEARADWELEGVLTEVLSRLPDAPPALKESWQHAAACLRTNNYLVAAPLLFELRRQPLSPEQAAVVDDVLKPILEQLYAAADRGDTAAIRVVTALQRRPRR